VEETVSSDILRRRAEIEDAIAGRTLCDELRHVAETAGDAYAYSDEAAAGGAAEWQSLTWSQARQRVQRWRLLPVEWTAETEELTPTLKLKRRVVHAKYATVIDSLYAG
jgi:long-subunit acyl-CoA synthetase (AMP-forming)